MSYLKNSVQCSTQGSNMKCTNRHEFFNQPELFFPKAKVLFSRVAHVLLQSFDPKSMAVPSLSFPSEKLSKEEMVPHANAFGEKVCRSFGQLVVRWVMHHPSLTLLPLRALHTVWKRTFCGRAKRDHTYAFANLIRFLLLQSFDLTFRHQTFKNSRN